VTEGDSPVRRPQTEAHLDFPSFRDLTFVRSQIFQSVIEESSVGHFPRPQKRIFRSLIENPVLGESKTNWRITDSWTTP